MPELIILNTPEEAALAEEWVADRGRAYGLRLWCALLTAPSNGSSLRMPPDY